MLGVRTIRMFTAIFVLALVNSTVANPLAVLSITWIFTPFGTVDAMIS